MTELAIQEKLESMLIQFKSMNNVRDMSTLSNISMVDTWLMRNNNTDGHNIVLKRLETNGTLWMLDSANRGPI